MTAVASTSPANILVVDDTIENLHLLSTMLGDQGYEIRPVTNGRQALQAADQDPPDLILLDINMPDMSGYDVCAQLKARASSQDVPVIFLTALSDTADKVKAFDVGGHDYITKPFQFDEVLARVKTHVALRRTRQELVESYDRLRALESLRDNLVHMVVHDMRSPLMVLMMNLDFLRTRLRRAGYTEGSAELREAMRAADVLTRMANDLLDVSRLEQGRMPVFHQPSDLVSIARDVAERVGCLDPTRPIAIDACGSVETVCDPTIVGRILENLVNNGIKHTPAGSPLRITLASQGSSVRIAVEDSGPGVPPEARELIFEKFGTAKTRHDQSYHSAGLGLAFCRLAVEAHGGTIGVEPREIGSRFWFELPTSA